MPSDPHVFDELKLPFIFVPHGEPEPTEWLASHPDYIKLPATFVPRAGSDGGTDPSSGSPPPGQRGTVDGLAPPPDPAATWRPTENAVPNATQAGTNESSDRTFIGADPIAAYCRANEALPTAASRYVCEPAVASNPPADVGNGPADRTTPLSSLVEQVGSAIWHAIITPAEAKEALPAQVEVPAVPTAQGTGPHVYVGANPGQWIGRKQVGDGECVALVEKATGAPRDKDWREGALVQGNTQLAPGTAIAVFDSNGRYGNHTDGTSHAAIYLRQDAQCIYVIDQWNQREGGRITRHRAPAETFIPFNQPRNEPIRQGESYRVIQ
jgi:hypothetical protein